VQEHFRSYFKNQQQYITINIYEDAHLSNFTKYVKHNHKYYDNSVNINVGSLEKKSEILLRRQDDKGIADTLMTESKYISQDVDYRITFDDEYLGVKGYYIWRKVTKERKDINNKPINEYTVLYVEYNILKTKDIVPADTINKINDFIKGLEKKNDNIILKYIKVMKHKDGGSYNHAVQFYSGTKQPFESLETQFMKPFFHQDKDRLWSVIKNVCMDPEFYRNRGQISRISLLLYGPPGTGKSSFAYRIAMCFLRHIVSLDIRELGKANLYQILQRPAIEGIADSTYKDVVFLFEEFDVSIKELYLRDKKTSFSSDVHYSTMLSMCNQLANKIYDKDGNNVQENYIQNNKNVDNDKNDNNKKTDTNDKDNDKTKQNIMNKLGKHGEKQHYDSEYVYEYFDKHTYEPPNEFKLRDLLEIFQGPLPFESMIMIANTNKYDEIHEMCPELFRPGRLTPVYFGYINKETLQDISKYFFGKKMTGYIPEVLNIPTSQVIDVAFEALVLEKEHSHDYFNKKIIELTS
jgi:SpoVK/Ycf46/Vps4 family AAA+-type ATPase